MYIELLNKMVEFKGNVPFRLKVKSLSVTTLITSTLFVILVAKLMSCRILGHVLVVC